MAACERRPRSRRRHAYRFVFGGASLALSRSVASKKPFGFSKTTKSFLHSQEPNASTSEKRHEPSSRNCTVKMVLPPSFICMSTDQVVDANASSPDVGLARRKKLAASAEASSLRVSSMRGMVAVTATRRLWAALGRWNACRPAQQARVKSSDATGRLIMLLMAVTGSMHGGHESIYIYYLSIW
jgi:hypothetical protein